jgi:hypothetical protein
MVQTENFLRKFSFSLCIVNYVYAHVAASFNAIVRVQNLFFHAYALSATFNNHFLLSYLIGGIKMGA